MTVCRTGLVLASAGGVRGALLRQIGYEADRVIVPDVDDVPLPDELPSRLVARVAMARAEAVHHSLRDDVLGSFVLAADTEVVAGGRALGTPGEPHQAEAMMRRLSGRAHRVVTAVAAIAPDGRRASRLAKARVRFKRLCASEIAGHLAGGHWKNRAGGYAIEGRAGRFAIAMSGSYSAIAGLPLYEACCILAGLGYLKGSLQR